MNGCGNFSTVYVQEQCENFEPNTGGNEGNEGECVYYPEDVLCPYCYAKKRKEELEDTVAGAKDEEDDQFEEAREEQAVRSEEPSGEQADRVKDARDEQHEQKEQEEDEKTDGEAVTG